MATLERSTVGFSTATVPDLSSRAVQALDAAPGAADAHPPLTGEQRRSSNQGLGIRILP